MYLLIACAGSWLVLLGSFFTAWKQLPQPLTTSDVVVLVIIGTGALLFSRIGVVSLLALLLRVLPYGRFRSVLAGVVVTAMPRLLASSVLVIVSAGLVVHSAQAAPITGPGPELTSSTQAPTDPGWPTVDDDERSADRAPLPDPGWPTESPPDNTPPSPSGDPPADESRRSDRADEPDRSGNSNEPGDETDVPAGPGTATHIVAHGESLWSIAADLADTPAEIPHLVADVYAANEDTIGPDPSLIIAGQRLEIQT